MISKLQANTAELEEILDMVNELPESTGAAPVIKSLSVTENGTYTAPNGVDGYSPVTVDVPVPDGYIVPSGTKEITENGTHDITKYASVAVNVATGGGGDDEALKGLIDRSITALTLPSDLTKIADHAFRGCTNLVLTELPDGITTIGSYAFYQCTQLAITELPDGITTIDTYAFRNCTGLTSITFKGTPSSIASNVFTSCAKLLTINVPWAQGAVENAPWGATNATINYNYTEG